MSITRVVVLTIFYFCLALNANSQSELNDADIKTALIYNISEQVNWENYASANNFIIGVYGNDPVMLASLKSIESYQIKGRRVIVKIFESLADIENTDVVYLNFSSNFDTDRIYRLIKSTNTLFVTDRNEQKRQTMINFLHHENGKIGFEVNRKNIEDENLSIKPKLLLLGGTELDIREMYVEAENELKEEQQKVNNISNRLKDKEAELYKRNQDLKQLEEEISKKNSAIILLSSEISEREQIFAEHEKTLEKQEAAIKRRDQNILQRNEEHNRLKSDLQTLFEQQKQQSKIVNDKSNHIKALDSLILTKEHVINTQGEHIDNQEGIIRSKTRMVYKLVVLGALMFVLILLSVRAYRQKKDLSKILEVKVDERTKELKVTNQNLETEIATRKKYEDDLIKSERNYREIFNSATDAIFIFDLTGNIVDVNSSMLKMYGYKKSEFATLDFKSISSNTEGYTAEKMQLLFGEAIERGEQLIDWQSKTKAGKIFWTEIALKRSMIGDEDRVLCLVRNIDERKAAQLELDKYRKHLEDMVEQRTQELKKSKENLEIVNIELAASNEEIQAANGELCEQREMLEANNKALNEQREELEATIVKLQNTQQRLVESEKMASVGLIASGVAHEINNPLNFIQGGVMALKVFFEDHPNGDDPDVNVILSGIETGVKRAAKIVKSLNLFSRKTESFDESCNIHDIIENSLVMLENKIRDRIKVSKKFTSNNVVLKGNTGKLHQVFLNILTNAVQAINDKGRVDIVTGVNENRVFVSIEDSGHGINAEILNKVTEPFFTTKEAGKGTGLGLAIVKNIIAEHKGEFTIESEVSKGTRIEILLPLDV